MLQDIILREIGELTRAVHAIIEVKFKSLDLQKGQSIYLTRICENPGISLMKLSHLLMVDKTAASKVVQKLIAKGFVLKKSNPNDKRGIELFPTEKADKVYIVLIEEENRLIRKCYFEFDNEKRALALKVIQKMKRNIGNDWQELKKLNLN